MKIVVAPDSFKESLTSIQAAQAIAQGIQAACPTAQIICVPMADGGEGTVAAVLAAQKGQARQTRVHDALGRPITAQWAWLDDATALIEMATAAGLEQIAVAERDACRADTYGVGELIRAALDAGARRLILGLGGSASTDGGSGMMRALGARFLDSLGRPLAPGGSTLATLAYIDLSQVDVRLAKIGIDIACDVDNPLCGPRGAAHFFGPQKGATPLQTRILDEALARLADVTHEHLGHDFRHAPGAGAAGGLGFAGHAFLRARFRTGVGLIAELNGLAHALEGATLVFTGEGQLDAQTLHGKTPAGVARLAQRAGVPVVALAGALTTGYDALHLNGLTAAFSLAPGPLTLAQSCQHAQTYLSERARDIMRLWLAAAKRRL